MLLGAGADVVCVQEASEKSEVDDDFSFMAEAGYMHVLHKKGRMRVLTFYLPSRLSLAGGPVCKDRTLITPFHVNAELRCVDPSAASRSRPLVWVVNAHLTAGGTAAGRRLRQVAETLDTVRKLAKKMAGGADPAEGTQHVIFCGDLNCEVAAGSGMDLLLSAGTVPKGYADVASPGEKPLSKAKRQPFGSFGDCYSQAFAGAAPPTLVVPALIERMVLPEEGSAGQEIRLAAGLTHAVERMFHKYSGGTEIMTPHAVDAWLTVINRVPTRGDESRAAAKFLQLRPAGMACAELVDLYRAEVAGGKFWGVAYDLWNTGCEEGCLPTLADVLGVLGQRVPPQTCTAGEAAWHSTCSVDPARYAEALQTLLGVFQARYDRVLYTTASGLVPSAVRQPSDPHTPAVCPNATSPSDHHPLAVTFEISSR